MGSFHIELETLRHSKNIFVQKLVRFYFEVFNSPESIWRCLKIYLFLMKNNELSFVRQRFAWSVAEMLFAWSSNTEV